MCCKNHITHFKHARGGGAMVLGKLPVSGHPTNLDSSRARTYCACIGAGGGCLDIFSLVYHFFSFSLSLGGGAVGWSDGPE